MNGYTEKILRIDLTGRTISTIPTCRYKEWVGGHGMGAAIFFDLVGDRIHEMQDGFHPANIITIMTSPLTGTLVPACAGRIEVQMVGVQSYPIGWYTRGCFGGRFAAMLKYAGWDGIVVEGAAATPVWLDIRDADVTICDCDELALWGKDAWDTQTSIWDYVADGRRYGNWINPGGQEHGQTTQRPAVVAIGPAGENLSRTACLIHDASNASGQGGFGAIWGQKKLKAISVVGTGGVHVHDPKALIEARLWIKERYSFKLSDLKTKDVNLSVGAPPVPYVMYQEEVEKTPGKEWYSRPKEGQRPQACFGCHSGCRARYESGIGNEAGCLETAMCPDAESVEVQRKAADLLNRYGLNAWEMVYTFNYIRTLNKQGILGPGKQIDSALDFTDYGTLPFVERFLRMAATKQVDGKPHPFAEALSEGAFRAAKKWGRLDTDLKTGDLDYAHWAIPRHYDPRTELEWGYGTILADRDVNEHDFCNVWDSASFADWMGRPFDITAAEAVNIVLPKLVPYNDDERILDYGDDNMYSEHMAKLVAWHRYYTRFWKVTVQFCDWRWPDFVNLNVPDKVGCTGEAEPRFFKVVTGRDLSFRDGIELGRKIWNLDHAIWTLQGRHRDQVKFADYIYDVPAKHVDGFKYLMPVLSDGQWEYKNCLGRSLRREGVEDFKTEYYKLERWDEKTGYPKRETLGQLGLAHVADELAKHERLG
ncbi:MAG: aldehyde ferredoxin oxidoreductase N-terminal domain-containing protein [Thermoguttaceae bacterium]|jgi:aldehyde:ferredoxin oxidoreductase